MRVSVVMASYNGEKYLYEQLDSLRDQSMPVDELIVCDDKSTDNTVKMLQEYIKANALENKWKVIVNDVNLGYANNFHKALQLAKGEYIFFCDQDDIWCLNKIEEMVRVLEENPKVQLLCTDYEPFACDENAPKVPESVMKKMKNDGSLELISLSKHNIYIASLGCDMCIRKTFRDQIEPFWIDKWAHDDYVWKTAQCVDGCYVYHKALIKRRLHATNVSMHKMHKKEVRVKFLTELAQANTGMYHFAESVNLQSNKLRFIKRTIKASQLRAELVEKGKLMNCFLLLGYLDCYQYKKSFLMEPYIAIKKLDK